MKFAIASSSTWRFRDSLLPWFCAHISHILCQTLPTPHFGALALIYFISSWTPPSGKSPMLLPLNMSLTELKLFCFQGPLILFPFSGATHHPESRLPLLNTVRLVPPLYPEVLIIQGVLGVY